MAPTYAHVGRRPHVGHVHSSNRLAGHTDPAPGKAHALNAAPGGGYYQRYDALCGEWVRCPDLDPLTGDTVTWHVRPAPDAAGTGVDCARCRRLLGVRRYEVQVRPLYGRRWLPAKDGGPFGSRPEAAARLAELAAAYPAATLRVRLV